MTYRTSRRRPSVPAGGAPQEPARVYAPLLPARSTGRRRSLAALTTLAALAALTAWEPSARAQVGPGGFSPGGASGPGGFGTPSPTKARPGAKAAPGQETHAASNAEANQSLQTQEPTLPQDPLAISPQVKKRIGTDVDADVETGRGPKTERDFYGLYYQEKSGDYRFRTLFPLWADRTMPGDRASFYGPYYNRRSKDADADVLFPFFWHLRDHDTRTTIVGPLMHRESDGTQGSPKRKDNWLAPLFFQGQSADGSGYLHVPPLLTFTQHTARSGLDIVGPMFCAWKGGPTCDTRTADKIEMGLPPLYFYGRDEASEYELIPPLLHYYRYNELGDRSLNIWGPVLSQRSPDGGAFNVMPFYWHNWGKNEDHLTVFPFFHYGYKGDSNLLVTPLFLNAKGENGESTFASWLYARYRGRTELDMVTPLYWRYRDPDIGLNTRLLFPFYYESTSPRGSDTAIFPFYGHFQKPGLYDTTWVSPLFRYTVDPGGWEANLFPLVYAGKHYESKHVVVAPLYWDFSTPTSRTTLMLPLFFRSQDQTSLTQITLNTYYHEHKGTLGSEWEFHFFPLFSYGQSPTGHWWNVLYGLAGYTREGTASRMRAFYANIPLSR